MRQLRVQAAGDPGARAELAGNVLGSGRLVQLEAELKMARVRVQSSIHSQFTPYEFSRWSVSDSEHQLYLYECSVSVQVHYVYYCMRVQATEHDLHKEIAKLEQAKKEVSQQLEATIFEKQKLLEKLKEMPALIEEQKEVLNE